jgi:hypothetical protein
MPENSAACDAEDDGGYRWTPKSVHALIELYGEHAHKFENSKLTKKQVDQVLTSLAFLFVALSRRSVQQLQRKY